MIFNRTKVIATIGPSCSQKTTLKKMLQQGVNAFRINMSHGDKEAKQSLFETINS
ncbi:MAG: pyruvate kinase, partial [Candidatus Marinimicrobia bacterium]|nr:pyruvate kinase [Candidatus Neomarinimicrobiota bacterium]